MQLHRIPPTTETLKFLSPPMAQSVVLLLQAVGPPLRPWTTPTHGLHQHHQRAVRVRRGLRDEAEEVLVFNLGSLGRIINFYDGKNGNPFFERELYSGYCMLQ